MENNSKSLFIGLGYTCAVMSLLLLPIVFTIVGICIAIVCLFSGRVTNGLIILILCICTGFVGASIGGWGFRLGKPDLKSFKTNPVSKDNFEGKWICNSATSKNNADVNRYVGQTYTLTKTDEPNISQDPFYDFFGEGWAGYFEPIDKNTLQLKSNSIHIQIRYEEKSQQIILNASDSGVEMTFSKAQ